MSSQRGEFERDRRGEKVVKENQKLYEKYSKLRD